MDISPAQASLRHYSGNYQQSYSGRKGVLVSGLSAVLIGAAPTIIAFFNAQGHGVRP